MGKLINYGYAIENAKLNFKGGSERVSDEMEEFCDER